MADLHSIKTRLGVVFPQTEIGDDVTVIREYALGAEIAGYDFLAAYDHVLGHRPADPKSWKAIGPYTDAHPFHEVFVLFSYLAAITTRLEFVTEVLVLPQRQTALVAKQAAELQLLSGGRLRLGIGVGWNPEEYRALGLDFHNRGRRVAEQVAVLRRLWGEELVTFHGEHHAIEAMSVRPWPPSPIPIWIGGYADVAIKRAAAIADGFVLDHELDEAPKVVSAIRAYLAGEGRNPEAFGLAARVQLHPGDIEAGVEEALAWQQLGMTHISVSTMNQDISDPRRHLQLVQEFMEAWRHRQS
ncbi:MAG TPA: LLM class F420-dependent oxidoreductase [Candidatus Dormibacteraeota bacterium]|nr:LLM class F420-dependent oxidoreductase [Candidatus Dormibacteraeota bacterium]